jgi:holo-[acyl-carrier protein] synthase
MPPRPFPYQLRIGIDVCNVPRIRNAISRSGAINLPILNLFLRRVLTSPERAYFWNRFGTEAHTKPDAVSQFLAGRYVVSRRPAA